MELGINYLSDLGMSNAVERSLVPAVPEKSASKLLKPVFN